MTQILEVAHLKPICAAERESQLCGEPATAYKLHAPSLASFLAQALPTLQLPLIRHQSQGKTMKLTSTLVAAILAATAAAQTCRSGRLYCGSDLLSTNRQNGGGTNTPTTSSNRPRPSGSGNNNNNNNNNNDDDDDDDDDASMYSY